VRLSGESHFRPTSFAGRPKSGQSPWLTVVHLLWLEIRDQARLGKVVADPTCLTAVLNGPEEMKTSKVSEISEVFGSFRLPRVRQVRFTLSGRAVKWFHQQRPPTPRLPLDRLEAFLDARDARDARDAKRGKPSQ
jgi:hypothetical protein